MKKRHFNKLFLLIIILLGLSGSQYLHAQGEAIRFRNISIEEGLSQSSGFCITQDSNGFMWFGTEAGLNRYDGYNFVIYQPVPGDTTSLCHSWIFSMVFDRQGYLWLGTENGLNRYDPKMENFTRYQHNGNDSESLSDNKVKYIIKDRSGNIWIGTDVGLNKYDRSKNKFVRYMKGNRGLLNDAIRCIFEDKMGTLWLGTYGGGFVKFDKKTETFTHFMNQPGQVNSLSDNLVLSIFEDAQGILWIGTERGGLNRYDRGTKRFTHYKNDPNNANSLSNNHVNVVYEDKNGNFWIGTNDGGLDRFDRATGMFLNYKHNPDNPTSIGSNRILSVFEDNTGGIWFGNYAGGFNLYNRESQKFAHYQAEQNNPNSLSNNKIRQVFEDHLGILWIGTDGGGLNKFDRKIKKYTHFLNDEKNRYSLSDNRVFSIVEDHDHVLWVGTYGGGLNKFLQQSGRFVRFQVDEKNSQGLSGNKIRSMVVDRENKLWIGTDGSGLNRFDHKSGEWRHFIHDSNNPDSIGGNRIFSLALGKEGVVWIGSYGGGVDRYDPQTDRLTHYTYKEGDPKSLVNNYILALLEVESGILWIGTDNGLVRLDQTNESYSVWTIREGLPDNVIYDIMMDETDCLWLCTNNGMSKFNPKNQTFKNYDMKDGLQSNEFNTGTAHRSKSGEMFMGGVKGFNSFFPSKIVDNPHKPQIVITKFQLFNNSVPIGRGEDGRTILKNSITVTDEIELLHKDKVLTLEFAALHYTSPENNKYSYMMEGFETGWNEVGNRRFVSYTGLPPGEYTFKVKGSNSDGVWNEKGRSLKIKIKPPFWQTTWFYTVAGLFILLVTVGIYRLRVRQLNARREELETLVKERTSQLADANTELEKLSIVASETDNAVVIMDANGKYEWFNEGYTRMFQYTLSEWTAAFGDNIFAASANPEIKDVVQRCVNEKTTITYESEGTTRSGQKKWTQTTLTPILGENGEIKRLIAIDSDISKIKEAEMAAERANQSKSEFLARMSHEIRTPMNGVIGFSDMLLDTELTVEQIDYARTISRSGEALITLLNDILDFSKIEAGELTIHPIDFDPEITVFDVCDIISPRIGGKNIELICRVGDTVPAYIKGDAGRFRQVTINLMGNAAKFTEEGEIELSLEVAEEKDDQLRLHVRVRDTGIGIAVEKVESVFDVFQQADGSTTRKYGGTGLGLTICKQISNLMGGEVWVESEEGVGSTFHFTAWMERSQKEVEQQAVYDYLEGKRVLIIDDNLTNLEILSHALKRSGMDVIRLTDPLDVIPGLKKNFEENKPVDICIIDIQMPKSSGYDVAREIRQLHAPLSEVPLLAYSSSTLSRSRKYQESGFDGYLPKPVHRKKLLKMVERLLGKVDEAEEEEIVTQHSITEETKHSVRILLAEDNVINLKLALFMLQKAGYQVTVAKNGEEVVDIFSKKPDRFDLILMDIQMPKLDGREATRILREKGFKDTPIVAMTAESMKGDREKCIEAGMDDYISKPIRREVVYKMVKKWCLEK